MERSEIDSRIKGIIAGMFDIKPEEVADSKPFIEMAKYDSMRALEFLAKLENEFEVTIDPDQLRDMGTVEKAAQAIEEHLRAK
jgi:acyl carrier protein